MKKINKTLICVLSAVLCMSSVFTGCSRDRGETVNEGQVQLLVGNFKGGYGKNWLNAAKARFEKKYENYDFGNGKVGVQIMIDDDSKYSGAIETKIKSFPQHVILGENINYYNMVDIETQDSKYLVDISDVVTTPINYDMITEKTDESFGTGTETIQDIMNESMEQYLNVDGNGKFYGIPFYEATVGIVYDVDVFEKYGFYYAQEGYGDEEGFIQDTSGNWVGENHANLGKADTVSYNDAVKAGVKLSAGPDGQVGTYDDGMPSTYADFFKLCLRMNARDVNPLTWPGSPEVQRYLNYLAYNLWADYEGLEQMNLNFSLNGKAKDLIKMDSFSGGTYETYEADITDANAYLLQQQAGKFEGINFIKELVSNKDYFDESLCLADTSQAEAERRFVLSALPSEKDCAMLIDGSWWMSEARSIFDDMAVDYGNQYSASNRRFGMLPLPKANQEKVGQKSTLAFNTATIIAVNKATTSDPTVLKIAKQFVKFLETHESLYEFNEITNSARPYNYELTETELNGLKSVAKQNYELHKATDFVFTYSKNAIVRKSPERTSCSGYLVYQTNGNQNEIISLTFNNNKTMTAWDYFRMMVEDHGEKFWNNTYSNELAR